MEDYGTLLLKEMFRRKNKEFDLDKLRKDHHFYEKETWTKADEEDFKQWAITFLMSKGWNKKKAEHELPYFLLNYGWKTEHDSN